MMSQYQASVRNELDMSIGDNIVGLNILFCELRDMNLPAMFGVSWGVLETGRILRSCCARSDGFSLIPEIVDVARGLFYFFFKIWTCRGLL